jgi:hypothetical protein
VLSRSRFTLIVSIAALAACGETPRKPVAPTLPAPDDVARTARTPVAQPEPDAPKKLLAIDWDTTTADSDAAALALWQKIAPTGADWDGKLEEIPVDRPIARQLAIALLHGGNFACRAAPATHSCTKQPLEIEAPKPAAGLDDPCLRRLLALWSVDQLEDDDLPAVHDAIDAILALPPPESQLVAAALHTVSDADQTTRLAALATAWNAGQHEIVNGVVGSLDEAHLIVAVRQHHIDGALEVLSAEAHRPAYLAAIDDEDMAPKARIQAISDVVASEDKLVPKTRAAVIAATKSLDCGVAAAAARALDQHGDHGFVPRRPHANTTAPMMRALCVLASFELLQRADESSLLPSYIPARGLELARVSYDPFSEVDLDGDGDPHTEHTIELLARDVATVPEVDDLVRAMRRCTGVICTTDEREFRFAFKPVSGELMLSRIEVAELPPCQDLPAVPAP